MGLLLTLAMGVELFAEEANALALGLGGVGKGERLEASGFVVSRPVFEGSPGSQRPRDVNAAGQNT